ncbi:type II secretion system protein GspC [Thalassotalea aquiviva]|uniref:type II secretion system protein GspC n=1 Tax=Thalassotalea aquiviva TaxID=3242415 RepID=UPI00352AC324
MDFTSVSARFQFLAGGAFQQRLTQTLFVGILVYIAYMLATLTWSMFSSHSATPPMIEVSSNQSLVSKRDSIQLEEVKKLHLFGEFNAKVIAPKVTPKVTSAPQTKLRLTLTGLVASNDDKVAAAIIESQGKQETYGIDDKIAGTRAVLKKVYSDRVIISSSGRMETLMLDGFEYTQDVPEVTDNKPSNGVKGSQLKSRFSRQQELENTGPKLQNLREKVANIRADILQNPAKLTDYIRISPQRKEGKVVGYRLMPNRDPEFFNEVGLKSGDVALQINGRDLSDMRQAQQALMELRKAEQVDLLVDRNGEQHSVSLRLK